jgi:hypothetical protein
MKRIRKIICNWFYTTENGEEYESYEVGHNEVVEIERHIPRNGLERDFCLVKLENGTEVIKFNVDSINFKEVD